MPEIVQVLFVRHGKREDGPDDSQTPLTVAAVEAAEGLREQLAPVLAKAGVFLTSTHRHASQTTELLAKRATVDRKECDKQHVTETGTAVQVVKSRVLTPKPPEPTVDGLVKEATGAVPDLDTLGGTIVAVGHDPRLSQLITMMTGVRLRPLDLLDVVCVQANGFRELRLGCGKIAWRFPVRSHGETDLRPKVTSKMTVATFLAGFTFTALIQILMNAHAPTEETLFVSPTLSAWLAAVAILCLTTAVALFVIAAYSYDRLNMPAGFWGVERGVPRLELSGDEALRLDTHGLIYWHMIRVWRRVFTPAVCCAATGFLLTVASRTSGWLALGCLAFLLAVVLYYWRTRPQLGVD